VPKPRCTHARRYFKTIKQPPNHQRSKKDQTHAQTPCRRLKESRSPRLLQCLGFLHHRGRTRFQPPPPPEIVEVRTTPAISGATVTRIPAAQFTNQPSPRPATASQVKAIRAIAARRKIDLVGLLRERFGLTTADELGIRQASNLIDELKSDEPTARPSTNGNGSYATTGGAR